MSNLRHFDRICEIQHKMEFICYTAGTRLRKEDAGMEKMNKSRKEVVVTFLKNVKETAVRNAGMASYKGSFEAKVPEKLKERK